MKEDKMKLIKHPGGRPKGSKNKKKKYVSIPPNIENFIIDCMTEESLDMTSLVEKYPDEVPFTVGAIHKHAAKNLEFFNKLSIGYECLLMANMDELDKISKSLASKTYMDDDSDWRQKEAMLKRRQDALKFKLSKLAPILSNRFHKATQLEVKGSIEHTGVPQIAVINYSQASDMPSPFKKLEKKDD